MHGSGRRWLQSVVPRRPPYTRPDVNDGNPPLELVVTAAVKEIRDSNRGCHAGRLEPCEEGLVIHDVVGEKPLVNSAVTKVPRGCVVEAPDGSDPRKKHDVVFSPESMASLCRLGRD
jgi:hypothetical protein